MMKNEFYKVDIQAKYTITNSLSKNINQYWKSDIAVSKEKNFWILLPEVILLYALTSSLIPAHMY